MSRRRKLKSRVTRKQQTKPSAARRGIPKPRGRAATRAAAGKPLISVTGRWRKRSHLIELDGAEVPLSNKLFATLCTLAAARLADIGPMVLHRVAIRRLRRKLNEASGRRCLGDELIVTAGDPKGTYLLVIATDDIEVRSAFREEVITGCLPAWVAETLMDWIERKPPRANRHVVTD